MLQKVSRVVERLQLLNVTNPSEESVQYLVAMLATTLQHPCDSTGLHTMVLDVKAAILPLRTRPVLQQLVVYPASPGLLPGYMVAAAYGTDDPPVMKQFDAMVAILQRIPMRNSNKSIAPHRAQLPASSSSSPSSPVDWMQVMMQHLLGGSVNMQPPLQRTPSLQLHSPMRVMQPLADVGSPGAPRGLDDTPVYLAGPAAAARPAAAIAGPAALMDAFRPSAAALVETDAETKASTDRVELLERLAAKAVGDGDGAAAADGEVAGKAKGAAKAGAKGKAVGKAVGKAKCKANAKNKCKAKAAGKAVCKAAGKAVGKAKAKCKGKVVMKVKKFLLGCAKCRGGHGGCKQCRDPAFTGKRYQK